MDNERKKLLELILGLRKESNRKSTLQLALEKARHSCGVAEDGSIDDIAFGFRQNREMILSAGLTDCLCTDEADLFNALLLYLNILEQLGVLFCGNGKGIKEAINEFSCNKDGQILRKLRHALAHNFGLVNVDPNNNYKPTTKFILSFDETSNEVVSKPERRWSGDYSNKSDETSTTVYVFPFIRMAEKIINNVKKLALDGEYELKLDQDEIESRFTIVLS